MNVKNLPVNIKVRIAVNFLRLLLNDMFTPFMAVYLTLHFGAAVSGAMIAVVISGGVLARFYGGYYADLRGRKFMLVRTEVWTFFVTLLMAACNSPWGTLPFLTYVLYFLHNLLGNLSGPANDALLVDASTPENRTFVYSISYWANNLAYAFGSIIGAFLYQDYFFYVLLATACASVVVCLVYLLFLEETLPAGGRDLPEKVNLRRLFASYKQVFQDRLFLKFTLASLLVMSIEYQLGTSVSVRLSREFGTQSLAGIPVNGIEMYGLLRAENTLGVVALAFFVNRLLAKLSGRKRLYAGLVLFTGGFMVAAVSNAPWVLLLAILVYSIGEMMYAPQKQARLADLIPEQARTRYLAAFSLNYRAAMMVASLSITAGAVLPSFGMALLIGVMGLLAISLFASGVF